MASKPPSNSQSPKPVKRLFAWLCLLLNLFVLPGLGSLITRQPLKAALQGVLALAGFALTVLGGAPLLTTIIQTKEIPESLGSSFWIAVGGAALFLVAWVWALISSLNILKQSRGCDSCPE